MEIFPSLKCALRTLAITLALGYIGLGLLLYLKQSRFIYYPSKIVSVSPADIRLPFEDLRLLTSDGVSIAAWYVPAENTGKTVLFFHGNGGNMGGRIDLVQAMHEMGLNVLIIDYRGYGNSEGRPSEEGTYLDADAAWQYLTGKLGVPGSDIVIYGRSLGGAVACWLAAEKAPAALVLESTFTSIPDMAAGQYPFLPVRLFCRFGYTTTDNVQNVRCPVLISHGRDDRVVPYEHGRKILDAANAPKQFVELTEGHNVCSLAVDWDYRDAFEEFIAATDGISEK